MGGTLVWQRAQVELKARSGTQGSNADVGLAVSLAPKPMHPTSKAIVGFYHLAARMDIAEWRLRSSGQEDHVAALAQAIGQGIKELNYVVDVLGPAEVLLFAPDFITYKASKMAVLLTRVSVNW
jgi:hypothetical protein